MALDVSTNDAAALTDSDLDELASMEDAFSTGQLSKAKEDWVLITTARFGGALHGFTFSTLERIGGTPCVLIGLMSVKRSAKRDQVLRGLVGEAYHRALMAFPDEDVVVGSRFVSADGLEAFKDLREVTPSPGSNAVGEERAWGRRLAKRFGVDAKYDANIVHRRCRSRWLPGPRILQARQTGPGCREDVRLRSGRQGRRHGGVRLDDGRRPGQTRQALNDMTEFAEVVRSRRMTRAFSDRPIDAERPRRLVDLASRAPSAGKTQGWHLVVLEGAETETFWDATLPAVRRDSFRWQGLLSAPVIALPLADAKAYVDRYAEPDKAQTGLGQQRIGVAGSVLDHRCVDGGDDLAARRRGCRPGGIVLRGVPR